MTDGFRRKRASVSKASARAVYAAIRDARARTAGSDPDRARADGFALAILVGQLSVWGEIPEDEQIRFDRAEP